MTNRLLAIVMAFALSSGIIAHAAKDESSRPPVLPLPQMSLSDRLATSLPGAIATDVVEEASTAIDNRGPVRDAYVRDQVALEHLRQSGSKLSCTRTSFNTVVSNDEAELVDMERNALAANDPLSTSVAEMDTLVASANNTLAKDEGVQCQHETEHEGSGTTSSSTPRTSSTPSPTPSPSSSPRPVDE